MGDSQLIPETLNNKPTRYRPFAGFRNSGTAGKAIYVAATMGVLFGWVPFIGQVGALLSLLPIIYMEYGAYKDAKTNQMEAIHFNQTLSDNAAASAGRSPVKDISQMPDINPDARGGFRAAEEARRAASVGRANFRQ